MSRKRESPLSDHEMYAIADELYDDIISFDENWEYTDVSLERFAWLPLVICEEYPRGVLWEAAIVLLENFQRELYK